MYFVDGETLSLIASMEYKRNKKTRLNFHQLIAFNNYICLPVKSQGAFTDKDDKRTEISVRGKQDGVRTGATLTVSFLLSIENLALV